MNFLSESTLIFNLILTNHYLSLQHRFHGHHSDQQPKGHRRHHRQSRKWWHKWCMELIPTDVEFSNKWLGLNTVLVWQGLFKTHLKKKFIFKSFCDTLSPAFKYFQRKCIVSFQLNMNHLRKHFIVEIYVISLCCGHKAWVWYIFNTCFCTYGNDNYACLPLLYFVLMYDIHVWFNRFSEGAVQTIYFKHRTNDFVLSLAAK